MENSGGIGTVTVSDAVIVKYRRKMVYHEWDRVLKKLYEKFYFAEWEKTLDEPGVVDGEEWELEVGLKSGKKVIFGGSNAYPQYWDELNKLFKPYFESSDAPAVPKRCGKKYRREHHYRGPVRE
ncbi:MAG: hypothetical protein LUD41_02660 [Phascolarctobacterium sp.]|nr:hypothetical protein [Phascolarctobacterium sp.]